MKTIKFGSQGSTVSAVGMGGEGILRTYGRDKEARAVIKEAVAQGIIYFDSARLSSDSEVYYGSIWGNILRRAMSNTGKGNERA